MANEIELKRLRAELQKRLRLTRRRAVLGDNSSPAVVDEPGKPGYVRVRYAASGNNSSGFTFPNVVRLRANISKNPGTPVIVGYDIDGEPAVIDADFNGLEQGGYNPLTSMVVNQDVNGFVDLNQSPLLRSQPKGPGQPLYVSVLPLIYIDAAGTLQWFAGQEIDLESYIPAGTGEWCLAGLFLTSANTVEVVTSTDQPLNDPLDETDIQECIDGRSTDALPIACWRLVNGQTSIADTDKFFDARQWINVPGGAGGTGAFTGDQQQMIWMGIV